MNKHLCWSCALVGADECPKWKSEKPNGFVFTERKLVGEKYMGVTVHECPTYEYDGECANCPYNTTTETGCAYGKCKNYISRAEGFCASENWNRRNNDKVGV